MFSKFSHLCGYKTQFRTERSYMRPPRPGGRGDLKEAEREERGEGGQTIKSVNIPAPEPGVHYTLHITDTVASAV